MLKILTAENFQDTISNGGIVIVDCWAEWCNACKDFEPVFKEMAARHPEHLFCKLDSQDQRDLVAELSVGHIPTLLLYRDGILLFQQPGYFDSDQMEDILRQAVSIDMDLVRAEIENGTNEKAEREA